MRLDRLRHMLLRLAAFAWIPSFGPHALEIPPCPRTGRATDLLAHDGLGVKFDHLFPRHAHSRISKSRSDATIVPTSAKSFHGRFGFFPHPEFDLRALFMGSNLILWRLFARHKI